MDCGLQEGRQGDGEWKNVRLAEGLELGEQPEGEGLDGVDDAGQLGVQCLTLEQKLVYGWDVHEEWSYVEQGVE